MRRPGGSRAARAVLALVLVSLAGACSAGRGGAPAPEAPGGVRGDGRDAEDRPVLASGWVRRVRGFPVMDSAGGAYAFPHLGGLDVPRPQFLDVDADGDDDLFLQERSGEVMFFERTPAGFVWRTDRYGGLEVGEWFRFGDVDMDGDPDLLAEEPFSHVRLYRNDGEPGSPRFVPAADTLRTVGGRPLFSDRQNIPNVGDVDCDGLQDLLVGRLDGTVSRFEVVATAEADDPGGDRGGAPAVPRFRHVTDRFEGIEIVNPFMGVRHGANSLVLTDFDDDGDLDLFWGDFFEAGLLYIQNRGSCERPDLRSRPVPFPPGDPLATSGFNAAAFGDLDGDGDRDLLVGVLGGAFDPLTTAADNLYHLERTEGGWSLRTRRFLDGVDVGGESRPALADLDGDGDLDLVLANAIDPAEPSGSVMALFENVGSRDRPAWRRAGSLPMRGDYHYAPAFGDLDGDGDEDLILGDWRDELAFYRNDGIGGEEAASSPGRWVRFTLVERRAAVLSRGSHAAPALGDLDGDGDPDLLVGEASGVLNFFRNVGEAGRSVFEPVSDAYAGIDVGRRSVPFPVDLDGDGDLDLLVGSESDGIRLFVNEGDRERPRFVGGGRLDAATRGLSAPLLRDVDGDGVPELFSGSAGGGLLLFQRGRRP